MPTHRPKTAVAPAKVVYFVASHVNPEQVIRLVRTLRSGNPDARVLIHHDQNVSRLDPAAVTGFGNVDFLERDPVGWGTIRSIEMLLHAMRWSVEKYDFDYMTYLSGQDYPVKPMARIERELGAACGEWDAFIDADPARDCEWHFGPERYLYRYYDMPQLRGANRLRNWLQRKSNAVRRRAELTGRTPRSLPRFFVARDKYGPRKIGIRPFSGPFGPGGFTIHAGSAWWTMSRRAACHVLEFVERHPSVLRHYQRVLFAPNESFFLTVLMNSPELRVQPHDNRRFIRWTNPQTAHPDVLTERDFDLLASSGCDFARKIDGTGNPALLDLLDRHQRNDRNAASE